MRLPVSLGILLVASLAGAVEDGGDAPPPRPEFAFAVTGDSTVSGGRIYPPFYGYVIGPHAVVRNKVVYCAFQDTKGRPIVMAFDTTKRTWSGPARASENGLGADGHGNPSICIDRADHIHIFYGCHGGPMRHTRSTQPLDITAWTEQRSPTERATYPQSMLMADGSMLLFYRAGGHMEPWSLRVSRDDGKSWGEAEKVIEMRLDPPDRLAAAYCNFFPGYQGKTVHCFWNHKDDNAAQVRADRPHPWRPLKYPGLHEAVYRYNCYYIHRDAEGVWRNAAGATPPLPVSKRTADTQCLVYDSKDEFTFVPYTSRSAVSVDNIPCLKLRTGVVDWIRNIDNPLTPIRSLYIRVADGRPQVSDTVPPAWSDRLKRMVHARGYLAWGDGSAGQWFVYCTRRRLAPDKGSFILLYNPETGYARRKAGPADLSIQE